MLAGLYRSKRFDGTGPACSGRDRIAPDGVEGAVQRQRHAQTPLVQQPRCDKAVAAIMSGTADHQHGLAWPQPPAHCVGDGPAGTLHQRCALGSVGNRSAVGGRHIRNAEQHRSIVVMTLHALIIGEAKAAGKHE